MSLRLNKNKEVIKEVIAMKIAFACLFIVLIVMSVAEGALDLTAKWSYYPLVWFSVLALCFVIDVLLESKGPTAIISVVCMFLFQAMWLVYLFAPEVADRTPYFHLIIWGALFTAIVTGMMVMGDSYWRSRCYPTYNKKEV